MFDLEIIGGALVDGTGRAPFTADIAVHDGRIVEIGACAGRARRTIDARGAHVLPGFVDLHTHYDGQVSWDPELSPSSLLGVTTCVMGSCGIGFAPVRPGSEAALVELVEGVEDIPGSALAEGIPWGWESVADYMTAIGAMPHAIDFLVQVPHDPLRMYVMGERAVAGEVATEDDIAAMRTLLREALAAGAAGFSSGRSDNHRTARGAATPASEVGVRELAGIAEAFRGVGHGVLQMVSDFDLMQGPDRFDPEFDLIEEMAAASGRPVSISTMQRDHAPDQWRRIFARVDRAAERGLDLRCQVASRGIGVLLGLEATFHPFMGFPSYKAIAHLPLEERVARMRDPGLRARILAETSDRVAGDGTPLPPLVDFFLANLANVAMRIYPMAARPDYEPALLHCIAAEASRAGAPVLAHLYDALLADAGKALLYFPVYNYTGMNLDVVREMLVHPRALVGLGDGGAHVGTVCDASMPVFLLTHWARDRSNGIPLERVVQMQARDNARFIGLADRGTLEVGMRADLNVVDLSRLALERPVMRRDLPAGGRRLIQRADGFIATLVAGIPIAEGGALTGARPGQLVRVGASVIAVAALAGVLTWTLLEYLIHRWMGHDLRFRRTPFGVEHVRHHSEGNYFAPTWKKLIIAALVALILLGPAIAIAGVAPGIAYVAALIAFYGAYEWIHRRDHTHAALTAYGRWARRHHFHHHFVDVRVNHGVTSPLWDVVFGTYRRPATIRVPARLAMRWLIDPATGAIRGEHAGTYELR